jgi:hypothetical protein
MYNGCAQILRLYKKGSLNIKKKLNINMLYFIGKGKLIRGY